MTEQVDTSAPETDAVVAENVDTEPTTKPTETVDFWKAKAREQEKRAKDNAAAAKRLSEIEDAQKTETQKLNEQFEAARAEADEARTELLRYRIASTHGINDADDIALFLTGSDEDTLTRQAERLAARNEESNRPRSPRPDPSQGASGSPAKGTPADSFAEFFRANT